MSILDFYYNAYHAITKEGYQNEIDYIDSMKSLSEFNAHEFFLEYVWVVLNAGMKEQIARKIYYNFCEDIDVNVINHPSKKKAVIHVMENYESVFEDLLLSTDKIEYLKTLPWIGNITKYHLARNIGFECIKPDRHLIRLAEVFGFRTPFIMCNYIKQNTNTKLGTIDIILWRYCNLHPDYLRGEL